MKKVKLYEEFVNEGKLTMDKLIQAIGKNVTARQLASYVYDNYDKVTGLKKSMRNSEMDFPQEILDLIAHYNVDIDAFEEAFGQ